MKDYLVPIALGGASGVLLTLLAWKFLSAKINEEVGAELLSGGDRLRATLDSELRRQIPPVVDQQMRATLSNYHITPTTGQQIADLLAAADRIGII